MKNTCAFTTVKIFVYVIMLGVIGSFSHFIYDLSGKNLIIGLFNPVNESVWEHLKFMFFPFLLWWIVMYPVKNKKYEIPLNTWIVSAGVSLVVAPLSVILLFYGYTSVLGIESLFIDILLVFICYSIALCTGNHFLRYAEPNKWIAVIAIIVISVIFISFIVFTFDPPKLPIFYDTATKTYGI